MKTDMFNRIMNWGISVFFLLSRSRLLAILISSSCYSDLSGLEEIRPDQL